jgi:hypothetical protein
MDGDHLVNGRNRSAMGVAVADDAEIREAHAAIVRAIAELRALGVAVPIALHQAAHALAWAQRERSDCRVLPFREPPR